MEADRSFNAARPLELDISSNNYSQQLSSDDISFANASRVETSFPTKRKAKKKKEKWWKKNGRRKVGGYRDERRGEKARFLGIDRVVDKFVISVAVRAIHRSESPPLRKNRHVRVAREDSFAL